MFIEFLVVRGSAGRSGQVIVGGLGMLSMQHCEYFANVGGELGMLSTGIELTLFERRVILPPLGNTVLSSPGVPLVPSNLDSLRIDGNVG